MAGALPLAASARAQSKRIPVGIEYYLIEQEIAGPAGQFAMAQKCMDNFKKMRG